MRSVGNYTTTYKTYGIKVKPPFRVVFTQGNHMDFSDQSVTCFLVFSSYMTSLAGLSLM